MNPYPVSTRSRIGAVLFYAAMGLGIVLIFCLGWLDPEDKVSRKQNLIRYAILVAVIVVTMAVSFYVLC